MNLEKKISIVIPIYNTEEFLDRCLRSIREQTYKNFEALMINDGSTDRSIEICEKYCLMDSRFRLINQKNVGLSESRNHGIRESSGEFIVFVDSDDYIAPNHLEYNLSISNSYDVDMVIFSYFVVKGDTTSDSEFLEPNLGLVSPEEALDKLIGGFFGNYSWKIFSRKAIFIQNQIKFPIDRQFEDAATTYKLIANAKSIYVTSQQLYYYVHRKNSITNFHNDRDLKDIIDTFKEMRNYVHEFHPTLETKVLKFEFNMIFMLIIRLKNWENHVNLNNSKSEKLFIRNATYRLNQILRSKEGKSRTFNRQRAKYYTLKTNTFPILLRLSKSFKRDEKNI